MSMTVTTTIMDSSTSEENVQSLIPASQQNILTSRHRRYIEVMNCVSERTSLAVADVRERGLRRLRAVNAELAAFYETIRQKIEQINITYQETIRVLEKEIAWLKENNQKRLSGLQKELESIEKTNAAEKEALEAQIEYTKSLHEAAYGAINKKIESLNLEHEQKVSRLNQQIAAASRAHQTTIEATRSENSRSISRVEADISDNEWNINTLQTQETQARAQNAVITKRLQALRQRMAEDQQEVEELRREAADCGFWDCFKSRRKKRDGFWAFAANLF